MCALGQHLASNGLSRAFVAPDEVDTCAVIVAEAPGEAQWPTARQSLLMTTHTEALPRVRASLANMDSVSTSAALQSLLEMIGEVDMPTHTFMQRLQEASVAIGTEIKQVYLTARSGASLLSTYMYNIATNQYV